jgi:uncharacterized protein involved in cysteine biosynthesis
MFDSLSRTVAQLTDPRLRSILVIAALASLALIVALAVAVGAGLSALAQTGMPWLDELIVWLGAIGTAVIALIFFPGSVQVVSSLFVDRVADAVEGRHYPGLPTAVPQSMANAVGDAMRLAVLSIGLNLLALPLYFLLPGFNLMIFLSLNGYLLGREYAEMVALRRMDREAVRAFRRANRWPLFAGGVVIAALSAVPVVNLTTPVVATAFAVHEHERLRRRTVPR